MPDIFDNFDQAPPAMQEMVFSFLEQRNAAPDKRAVLDSYLAEIVFPPNAHVLEVGCGSGSVTRVLAQWPGVGDVIGVEPWAAFITKARELGAGIPNLSFEQADGHALPFEDASFDAVVFHTTLLHMHDPATALAEAHRILRAGGSLSVFDPDPQATTYAISAHDPIQTVNETFIATAYQNPWLPRQLPGLIRAAGFASSRARVYGTMITGEDTFALAKLDSDLDAVTRSGGIGSELAAALKVEARRRIELGTFIKIDASVSIIARKGA